LDVVFLHDVEYVCSSVHPVDSTGDPTKILENKELPAAWGLGEGYEDQVHGDGDQKIIDALDELKKLKDEGIVHEIGLTGKQTECI
jgi:D-arabinose 1-dehydrogenase